MSTTATIDRVFAIAERGQTVILQATASLSGPQMAEIRKQLDSATVRTGVEFVILNAGLEVATIRKEDTDA